MGKKVASTIRRLKKQHYMTIAAALTIAIAYYFCSRYSYMIYHTNDDYSIQSYLSGFYSGVNDPLHSFISIFIGYPLSMLYRILPKYNWWYWYSQLLMVLGGLLVVKSVLDKTKPIPISAFAAVIGIVTYLMMFFMPAISSTAFTIVPAVLGGGLIAGVISLDLSKKSGTKRLVIYCALFFLCFFHREKSGIVILLFLLLAVLYSAIKTLEVKKAFRLWMIVACCLIFASYSLSAINTAYRDSVNGNEFVEFNRARVRFTDYPVDSYDDNPDLYTKAGWNRDTYLMADNWCFIDERISAESFDFITSNSNSRNQSLKVVIKNAWTNPLKKALIIGAGISAILSAVLLARGLNWREILFLAMDIGGTAVLIAYQIVNRRIIYRSMVVVLLPSFVIIWMLLMSGDLHKASKRAELSPSRKKSVFLGIVFVASAIILFVNSYTVMKRYVDCANGSFPVPRDTDDEVNSYIMNHKDNFYVTAGIKTNTNPRHLYPGENIANSISWGGSGYGNKANRRKLESVGIDALNVEVFLRDNVYLLCRIDDEVVKEDNQLEESLKDNVFYAFCRFVKERYPDKTLTKVDTIGSNVYVYALM